MPPSARKTTTTRRKPKTEEAPTGEQIAEESLTAARNGGVPEDILAAIAEKLDPDAAAAALKARTQRQRLDAIDVPIEGLGTFRVRPLTQGEVRAVREASKRKGAPDDEFDCALVAASMVRPHYTVEEVRTWFTSCPFGEVGRVMGAVSQVSKLDVDAQKSNVLGDGGRSGA